MDTYTRRDLDRTSYLLLLDGRVVEAPLWATRRRRLTLCGVEATYILAVFHKLPRDHPLLLWFGRALAKLPIKNGGSVLVAVIGRERADVGLCEVLTQEEIRTHTRDLASVALAS